jgi:DNA repair protein RadC
METTFARTNKNPLLGTLKKSDELAEVKVIYTSKRKGITRLTSSKDAYGILYPLFDQDTIEFKEDFFLLVLNRANTVLGWVRLSSGGTCGTVVDVKIIFMIALLTNAHCIIMCHNHPSGNLTASREDILLTNRVKEVGKILNVYLYDHIIICKGDSYFSFANEGLL